MTRLFNQNKEESSFYVTIAPIIAIAQFFEMFPVVGIFSKNIDKIKFKLWSIRTIYSIMWIFSVIVFVFLAIVKDEEINAKSIAPVAFYSICLSTGIFFFRLSIKWNELLNKFAEVEEIFLKKPYSLSDWTLKKRIHVTAFFMLTLALIEHLMSWFSFFHDHIVQANECVWEIDSWFFYLATTHLPQVFRQLPATVPVVLWAEFMTVSMTFAWNFIDIFTILMSLSISTKFKMINERLQNFKGKNVSDVIWDEIRCHYNKVCELNEFIGDAFGNLICVGCLNDLYFVCLQLLNVATPLPYLANKIYFWYSLVFLIFRTFAMFMFSAAINDESIKPLQFFRSLTNEGYYKETRRLFKQIKQNQVALSGNRFFFLTHGIIIKIAGTIITYELFLIQFGGVKVISEMFNPCTVVPAYLVNKN